MNLPESTPPDPDGAGDLIDPLLGIPRRLGGFRLVREVGRGGMGLVFEAEDLTLGRRVALKILPLATILRADQVDRFHLEAQLVARLAHPNILPIYSVGRERGVSFFAMPLVAGSNLAEIVHEMARPRPLGHGPSRLGDAPEATAPAPSSSPLVDLAGDPARFGDFCRAVADLGRQAALALAHSHEAGVWHRDIKPANLLIEADGHLWVTDFGLARLAGNADGASDGDPIGTLRYMSPEQAAGDSALIDGRTDIFSLGMTLLETLSRRPSGVGGDGSTPGRAERMPPRADDPAIPVDLATILARATARRPDDRYATATALADDLRRFVEGEPIAARRPRLGERLYRWATRPERITEAAQAVFWFGVLLTASNLGALLGFAIDWFRPPNAPRFLRELAIGFLVFDLPTLGAGIWALRGGRGGLVLGLLAVLHFLLLVLSSLTGFIMVGYGGITRDLGERWVFELILILLTGSTLGRVAAGLLAARARRRVDRPGRAGGVIGALGRRP